MATNKYLNAFNRRFESFTKKAVKSEKALNSIVNNFLKAPEKTKKYWDDVKKKINNEYKKITGQYIDWADAEIPKQYRFNVRDEMKKAKKLKSVKREPAKGTIKLLNSNDSKATQSLLANGAIDDMIAGLEIGRKDLLKLTRITRQNLISEKVLNEAIQDAIQEGNLQKANILSREGTLANKLQKASMDGRFITIVNKNGKKMRFGIKSYSELVSRTKWHEAQTEAVKVVNKNYDTDLVRVSSHNTTTAICQQYEAKIFSLTGKDKRFPVADAVPPFHPNCYAKNTKVMTHRGWLYFWEVSIKDKIFSLNPKTLSPEWVGIEKKIEHFEKELINFKTNNINISVTYNHNMFYITDWNHKYNKNKFELVKAKTLYKKKSGAMFASCLWKEKNKIENINFEFMGYYMSEGSVYHQSTNSYQISISQDRIKNTYKYNKMLKCMEKKFPKNNIIKQKERLIVYNILGRELKKLGLSYEKKIPSYIMNGSKEQIKIFLKAFLLGDRHKSKPKKWIENFKSSISYFTSSKIMAAQLCELIIKTGKRPSLRTQKGKLNNFKNGKYFCRDIYVIRECNSKYHSLQNMKYKKIKYNDLVFCLTLKKNHIMLVTSDCHSGVLWCGNCLHYLTTTFIETLEATGQTEAYSDFSKGKTDRPPGKENFVPIKERNKIVKEQTKKIKNSAKYEKATPKQKQRILKMGVSQAIGKAA